MFEMVNLYSICKQYKTLSKLISMYFQLPIGDTFPNLENWAFELTLVDVHFLILK